MSASPTERRILQTAFAYLLVTFLCAVAGAVYEHFSHGVWSGFMVYAFLFPLTLGALPFGWMTLREKPLPCPWALRFHHAGVATLTTGSFMEGILAIYGTTNQLTTVYWVVGTGLILGGSILSLLKRKSA